MTRALERKRPPAGVALAGPAAALAFVLVGPVHAATFTVTTNNDYGNGSLRQVIEAANASPGPDEIVFTVTGDIHLSSELPAITDDVRILGGGAVVVRGNGTSRLLGIAGGTTVEIEDLSIGGGRVEGVDDAGNGGCVLNAGTLVLRGVTLQDCQAERGGAIHNRGILSIADSRIRMGTALEGGGVHNARDALLALSGSTIEDCFASHHGGGIDAVDSIVMVSRSTIRTSRANVSGGAIAMRWSPGVQPPSGLLRLEESVLQANWADMTGGGVYNDRQLVALIASTLAGNSSPGRGGGVYTTGQTAVVHALNATFSGNEAGNGGGALENDHVYPSQVELVQASLVDNRGWNAAVEGGFASRRSLLANTGANCFVPNGMTLDDAGGNFASDASCAGFNLASREAMALGPLADNGGPTPTHALLPGSVALDVEGDCTDLAGHPVGSDQRGFARPADGDGDGIARCDAGAYERTGDTVFADGFDG